MEQQRYISRAIETTEGWEDYAIWDTQTNCWVADSTNSAIEAVDELANRLNEKHAKQDKECISVEDAANMHCADYFKAKETAYSSFKVGAKWQKEQPDPEKVELIKALQSIAAWPGNLPDEQYTSRTGANEAMARGLMVVAMRSIANETLKKLNL